VKEVAACNKKKKPNLLSIVACEAKKKPEIKKVRRKI
jgi:hypothetical protein